MTLTGRHKAGSIGALAALTLAAAACGGDPAGVQASGAWARTSPMMAESGAAYMTLSADEATTIVSVSAPPEVAGRAELHETVPIDDTMGDGDDDSMASSDGDGDGDSMASSDGDDPSTGHDGDGAMGDMPMAMQEVASLEIPADGSIALEPGGHHVMLLDLPAPLEVGTTFQLTFTEADGDQFVVDVEVRDDAP